MGVTDSEVTALVKRAGEGDSQAEESLYQHAHEIAFKAAYRILHQKADALDVVQASLTKVFVYLRDNALRSSFDGLVFKTAQREAIRIYNNRRRTEPLLDETILPDPADDPASLLIHRELRQLLDDAVEQLPGEQKRVMQMYFRGYAAAEIADAFGKPPGTIRKCIHDARQGLKKRLEGKYTDSRKDAV